MEQKILLDTSSGISGDMIAGAFIQLAGCEAEVKAALAPFAEDGCTVNFQETEYDSLTCLDISIETSRAEPLSHSHHSLKDVTDVIQKAAVSPSARRYALRVYDLLADSEAKAHHTTPDRVVFHEVGSMPSILNVLAFAVSYDLLGVREVIIPSFTEGTGTFTCSHGELAIPGPAVTGLLSQSGIPLNIRKDIHAELITPTGAACALSVCTGKTVSGPVRTVKTGYGSGKRKTGLSPVLKAVLLESED